MIIQKKKQRNYYLIVLFFFLGIRELPYSNSLECSENPIKFRGMCYGAFREGGPGAGEIIQESNIDEDLAILASIGVNEIRTYSVGLNGDKIPIIAKSKNISCATGLWLGGSNSDNLNEMDLALSLEKYSSSFIVENELIFSGQKNISEILEFGKYMRERTDLPLAISEPDYILDANPQLFENFDIILINIYPFWSGVSLNNAANYTLNRINEFKILYPSKDIRIGETGWPSEEGENCSEENQKKYMLDILQGFAQDDTNAYLFEAFDENWKSETYNGADIGPHWGLFHENRTAKLAGAEIGDFFTDCSDKLNNSKKTIQSYSLKIVLVCVFSPVLLKIIMIKKRKI